MSLRYIQEVVVASADVAAAVAFHRGSFGLEPLAGPDPSDGVLLGVPGVAGGRLRIVPTDAAVVDPPAVWDLGARLLGIYSSKLPDSLGPVPRGRSVTVRVERSP